MRYNRSRLGTLLLAGLLTAGTAEAIDHVYLVSGGTLVAERYRQLEDETYEIVLLNKAKLYLSPSEIDRILHETAPPVQLSELVLDEEAVLPDVTDPENWVLDLEPSTPEDFRLFLGIEEQVRRGVELPLARSLSDLRYAQKRRLKQIEFLGRVLHLGMDMQYHESPGVDYEAASFLLDRVEDELSFERVEEYIRQVRASAYDIRKKRLISYAIVNLRPKVHPALQGR